MTGLVEKNYGEALFQVAEEEKQDIKVMLNELAAITQILADCPDFVKLTSTPTIEFSEKKAVIDEAFKGKVNDYVYNFLLLLTEEKRIGCFTGIYNYFLSLYNQKFNIADITVTSTLKLSDEQREKIVAKMSEITGKTINVTEKVDPALIGGIVIDYGSERYDGSVKTRLEALRQSIGEII